QVPYMAELQKIYSATARWPLRPFDKSKSVGSKMRFRPQRASEPMRRLFRRPCPHLAVNRLRGPDAVAFVTIREDVLRWALSKYHGDGTGRPGHLQFRLARRKIRRSRIPKIHVDLNEFRQLLQTCEETVARKWELIERLNARGVTAWPML